MNTFFPIAFRRRAPEEPGPAAQVPPLHPEALVESLPAV